MPRVRTLTHRLLPVLTAGLLLFGPGTGAARADDPAPAQQPGAAQAQTFGIQPATDGKPDTRGAFSYSATPGAILKDQVAIGNYSDQPLTLQLYAADAFNTDNGGYDVLAAGKPSTQAGSWLKTGTDHLTLPGHTQQVVPFTLAVPADASPGDHAAGIVVALRVDTKDAKGNTVTVDQRVGARVNLRVAGDLKAELRVEDVRTVYHPSADPLDSGHTTISYVVANTGNVRLGGRQAVRVTNAFGMPATAPGSPDLKELLPGNVVRYQLDVSGAYPTLWSTAGITVDPLAVAGDKDPKLSSSTDKHRFASIPWALLGVLVVLGALGEFVRRRRRRPAPPATPPGPPAAGGPETGGGPSTTAAEADAAAVEPVGVAVPVPATASRSGSATSGSGAAAATGGAALLLLLALAGAGLAGAPRALADTPTPTAVPGAADSASAVPGPVTGPGTLAFDYPTGHDDDPIDMLSSGRCPNPAADYLTVRIAGPGFPAEGSVLNGNTPAAVYRVAANGGYVLPLTNTLRTAATGQGVAVLHGDYTVTASCHGRLSPTSVRDFSGVLTFATPTTWQAAAVAPAGVIHAADTDPAPADPPVNRTAPAAAARPAPGTPVAAWVAMGLGAALLGWIGLPRLLRRRARANGAGA
ncbi:WxL protein peptidoglycan domain-containing protein [Kitasatospora sp. NPDC006697]|uniref:WxL protein peptidoglycan domain-containing protein n=1 Tax=Kitasatospora sp. NPDC006697 TaxID=3364020 RepID=UPI0036CCDD76